jgi:AI-2 transport protein TqsA
VLGLLTLALIVSVAQLAELLPQYEDQITEVVADSNLFFLIVLLFFMAFDTNSTRRSLAVLGERMPDLAATLSSFARGARNYMGVSAGFGFIVAVLDGVALQIMGVPGAGVRVGRPRLRHQLHP